MNIINEFKYDVLRAALNAVSNELGINIYTMDKDFRSKEPEVYGVNWGARGTQDSKATREYAEKLMIAAKIADMLTGLEIRCDYSLEYDEEDRQSYREECEKAFQLIKLADAVIMQAWLNK